MYFFFFLLVARQKEEEKYEKEEGKHAIVYVSLRLKSLVIISKCISYSIYPYTFGFAESLTLPIVTYGYTVGN